MKNVINKPVNKWDVPSSEDFFGRAPFVDTIVNTIQSAKEGFNLGISARWGEGKSSILEQLRPKLEKLNYKVLTFEPWKYTQDSISIKRKFIIDIYSQLGKDYNEAELYNSTEVQKELKASEYFNIYKNRITIFLALALLTTLILLLLLIAVETISGMDLNIMQLMLANLFIPILVGLIPLITKLTEVTIKQTIPKIESAEQFEKRFNNLIDDLTKETNPPDKIIIFVDDLDRCNHTEVEQILTALFTFFNNKHCTYIITADHTVIRRYISHFLQLEDERDSDGNPDIVKTNATREKEATEYLKKIFQINFILPKIPSELLEIMIRNLIKESPAINFKNPYAQDYLVNLILNNFQGNPRKIKHFIRTLEFQLEAIGKKIEYLSPTANEEKSNLHKVLDSPELLAKILIIQDRFPDYYEQIVVMPRLLQKQEEGDILDNKDLQNLLAHEPKFFNSLTRENHLKTIDPYYFIYFSGSTGFVETKTLDPAEVKSLARSGDYEGLSNVIKGLTDEPRNVQFEIIKREYDVQDIQVPEKVNVIRSLFQIAGLIEEPSLRLQKIRDLIDNKDKYAAELSSLQSIDFEMIIPFINVDLAHILCSEPPFTNPDTQIQLLNAFVSKQMKIDKNQISDRFIQLISEGIKRNDNFSIHHLELMKKLAHGHFERSILLQEALLSTYNVAEDNFKYMLIDVLISKAMELHPTNKQVYEELVNKIIQSSPINESVSILGNIPERINNKTIKISELKNSILNRIKNSEQSEIEPLFNETFLPQVAEGLGQSNMDSIIISLIEILKSDISYKRVFVLNKLPALIDLYSNKSHLLKLLTLHIGANTYSEGSQILTVLMNMNDFWVSNPNITKKFAQDLLVSSKGLSDADIQKEMVDASHKLLPPKETKKSREQ